MLKRSGKDSKPKQLKCFGFASLTLFFWFFPYFYKTTQPYIGNIRNGNVTNHLRNAFGMAKLSRNALA